MSNQGILAGNGSAGTTSSSPFRRIGTWAIDNQFKIIFGSWVAGMAVAGGLISRNKFLTTSQKVVQTRMWAQGLTIGVILAAGIATQSKRHVGEMHHAPIDHSWESTMAAEQKLEAERKERLRRYAQEPSTSYSTTKD